MSADIEELFKAEMRARINERDAPPPPYARVTRGRIVMTFGPWSNGHDEQCAIVTHVHGNGDAPATLLNLHVFVDEGQSLIVTEVPWYATFQEAEQAMRANGDTLTGGRPIVCYFPDKA